MGNDRVCIYERWRMAGGMAVKPWLARAVNATMDSEIAVKESRLQGMGSELILNIKK